MTTATITLPISDKICRELLTTCFEGGSAYWLACDSVVYTGHDTDEYGVSKIVGCADAEDESTKWGDADFDTIRKGIAAMLGAEGEKKVNSTTISNIAMLLIDPDSADYDADDADCVLQMGLFGELVYG